MFDRFTDRARKIMGFARGAAKDGGQQYIGTGHILLGILEEGAGVAAAALRNLKVDLDVLSAVIKKLESASPINVGGGQLPFTPRVKRALEESSAAAEELRHNYIGTEHLLLGIIADTEGTATKALTAVGLSPRQIHDEIYNLLGATVSDTEEKPAARTLSADEFFLTANAFFDRYQAFTGSVALYPGAGTGNYDAMTYVALKGAGECGEFAEKLGKQIRKQGDIRAISRDNMDAELRLELAKELGDRLWYISQAAAELGFKLSEIAQINIDKLTSRKERGVIVGEGDNR